MVVNGCIFTPGLSIRRNDSVTLNLLYLGLEKKQIKCYTGYLINKHVFHIKKYGYDRKIYSNEIYIKRLTSNKLEVDYYEIHIKI